MKYATTQDLIRVNDEAVVNDFNEALAAAFFDDVHPDGLHVLVHAIPHGRSASIGGWSCFASSTRRLLGKSRRIETSNVHRSSSPESGAFATPELAASGNVLETSAGKARRLGSERETAE